MLGLRTLEMEDFDEPSSSPLKSTAREKKTNLDFLIHERDELSNLGLNVM